MTRGGRSPAIPTGMIDWRRPVSADVSLWSLPADRQAYWSEAGVTLTGTIPERPTYQTLLPSGGIDGPAIKAALSTCPVGYQVLLGPGLFRLRDNDTLQIPSYVTLRGSGAGVTTIQHVRADGISPAAVRTTVDGYLLPAYAPMVIIAPTRYPHWAVASFGVNLSANALQGSDTITVADASSFSVGQYVSLDEDQFFSGGWQNRPDANGLPNAHQIWTADRVSWRLFNPPGPASDFAPGPIDAFGPLGDQPQNALGFFSRGGGRVLGEIKQILSINGNQIRFTAPCHTTYRAGAPYHAQLIGADTPFVVHAGIQDLTLANASSGAVQFNAAAHCWAKNIEVVEWLGHGVSFSLAYRCELRDSYVHYAAWPVPGGGGYGVSFQFNSSECLVENNIVGPGGRTDPTLPGGVNKCIVSNSAGAGCVIAYNYMTDSMIMDETGAATNWQETGINGSHWAGAHSMLFDGNKSVNADSDNTHGSSWRHTFFRNHLTGSRHAFGAVDGANERCFGLMFGSTFMAAVGNVLGEPGQMAGWISDGTVFANPAQPQVWKIGYDPGDWAMDPDPTVLATLLSVENYDHRASARTDPTGLALPPSLYRTTKPAFFGTQPWPGIDPVTGVASSSPAELRFLAGTPNQVP